MELEIDDKFWIYPDLELSSIVCLEVSCTSEMLRELTQWCTNALARLHSKGFTCGKKIDSNFDLGSIESSENCCLPEVWGKMTHDHYIFYSVLCKLQNASESFRIVTASQSGAKLAQLGFRLNEKHVYHLVKHHRSE